MDQRNWGRICLGRARAVGSWVYAHHQVIQSISSVLGLVAIIVAIIRLHATREHLELAARQLEASTVFEIQAQGRDLMQSLVSVPQTGANNESRHFQSGENHSQTIPTIYMPLITHYYMSIILQWRLGAISEETWPLFRREICSLERNAPEVWNDLTALINEVALPVQLSGGADEEDVICRA